MTTAQKASHISILPYSKVVGHRDLKLALEIAYIAGSRLGGVLVSGHRGTGKSTTARAFAKMVYGHLPVTLPINATEDRVVGGWQIDALMQGNPIPQTGLLVEANGKILYIDEVNLLDDHVVNIILDTAATGILSVQRQGIDIPETKTHFTLVGTMNPEEGHLRPQLRDRFGLMVHVTTRPEDRAAILQTLLAFDEADVGQIANSSFMADGRDADALTKATLEAARNNLYTVLISDDLAQQCIALAETFEAVGHRADYFLALATRARASRLGVGEAIVEHLRDVAPLVLTHRRRERSEFWSKEDNERVAELLGVDPAVDMNLSQRM